MRNILHKNNSDTGGTFQKCIYLSCKSDSVLLSNNYQFYLNLRKFELNWNSDIPNSYVLSEHIYSLLDWKLFLWIYITYFQFYKVLFALIFSTFRITSFFFKFYWDFRFPIVFHFKNDWSLFSSLNWRICFTI